MRCEVCGRQIYGKPYKVVIEGAKLTVCNQCSKYGTTTWQDTRPKAITKKTKASPLTARVQSIKTSETMVKTEKELVENYDAVIRQARERLGLSHEELGKKISEKVSVLRKIETRKMTPDNVLATKLEHVLKVKLLVTTPEDKTQKIKMPQTISREVTLGDLIKLDDDDAKKEETTERKQS